MMQPDETEPTLQTLIIQNNKVIKQMTQAYRQQQKTEPSFSKFNSKYIKARQGPVVLLQTLMTESASQSRAFLKNVDEAIKKQGKTLSEDAREHFIAWLASNDSASRAAHDFLQKQLAYLASPDTGLDIRYRLELLQKIKEDMLALHENQVAVDKQQLDAFIASGLFPGDSKAAQKRAELKLHLNEALDKAHAQEKNNLNALCERAEAMLQQFENTAVLDALKADQDRKLLMIQPQEALVKAAQLKLDKYSKESGNTELTILNDSLAEMGNAELLGYMEKNALPLTLKDLDEVKSDKLEIKNNKNSGHSYFLFSSDLEFGSKHDGGYSALGNSRFEGLRSKMDKQIESILLASGFPTGVALGQQQDKSFVLNATLSNLHSLGARGARIETLRMAAEKAVFECGILPENLTLNLNGRSVNEEILTPEFMHRHTKAVEAHNEKQKDLSDPSWKNPGSK